MNQITQFLISHGGLFLFVVGFAEQNGLPLPGAPWLLAAGALSASGKFSLLAAIGWTAVNLIGGHVSYINMLAIESALCAIRSAAVIVPSAMGVQEASYAMLMPLFGMGPEIGVALSLLKRACNIAIGIPVLLSWQGLEGRHAVSLVTRDERLSEN